MCRKFRVYIQNLIRIDRTTKICPRGNKHDYGMCTRHPHQDQQVQMLRSCCSYRSKYRYWSSDMASRTSDCPKGPEGVKVAKLRELFQSTSDTSLPQRIVTDTVTAEVSESAKKTRHSQSTVEPDKPEAQDGKQSSQRGHAQRTCLSRILCALSQAHSPTLCFTPPHLSPQN